jgi:predicted helicase
VCYKRVIARREVKHTMIRDLLQQYREGATVNRDLGDRFERLVCAYLTLDPKYVALFSAVWLWKDWPEREARGYKLPDTGIDLVAKLRDEDGYCAIQCKFHETAIRLEDLGSFFTLSGKGGFTQRLIVATAPLTKHAADALDGQTIPVGLITLDDLEAAPIDWSQFSLDQPEQLRKSQHKTPLPHQQEALANVLKGFAQHDRGRLIMACGTGKTYTSLLIAEAMLKPGQCVLFLVPSIALLSQTLRAWTADARVPLRCYAVCSDSKASRTEEDMRIHELAYPATTDADKLAASLKARHGSDALTVIFSTYQSIDVVHQAQKQTGLVFDLVVCDEAHRTAGYTPPGEDHSPFVRVHDPAYIRGSKRLYMTATPRIYADTSKSKAEEHNIEVYSMDDEATFGPEFHRLRFDEAVRRDLLSDYKVLVIAVDELHVSQVLNRRLADEGDELKLDDAVKIVGCWNGLAKRVVAEDGVDVAVDPEPMRTAIAFSQSIKHSKLVAAEFERVSQALGREIEDMPRLEARHVDGTMNVVERNRLLSWLKADAGDEPTCRILTNARCLSEGVDVPALDAVVFLNPRDSVVDVVQSVGRVMRKDPAGRKKYGYVILPIGIRRDSAPEKALDDNRKYRVVWQVLNALRAHDDRLDKQFATIDLLGKANGVVNVIGVGGGSDANGSVSQQLALSFDPEELSKWQDALLAKIVHKCGNRRYWEDWAKDIAIIAGHHVTRIKALLAKPYSRARKEFNRFLEGLRRNINPSITEAEAIEMLAQHIITRPVFDALFEGYAFTAHNPVSRSMQSIMDILDAQALDKEHETLEGFYASVRERVSGITDPTGRQKIIVELYDKFFQTAFPRMVERLGIVYTPVEIVDFILASADAALREHFGMCLADENVHILDPFTGTGTFPVRLIETGLIPADRLPFKYRHELHANEIVLLAYYIAAVNIEEAFHRVTGLDYEPFPGIVLTDTFQMGEAEQGDIVAGLPENHERVDRQKRRDIRVIVGNPPYSVGQENANDNNQNLKYPALDARIAATYAAHSRATNKNSLYDSYIRAFRWASDRIKDEGVICFVTNGGWIDGNAMDGFRKTLADEFSAIYVFNLRGNARTQGELRRMEAGNVFGSGSRTPVAITLLVKKKDKTGPTTIRYHDIGDYLTREQKLAIVAGFGSYQAVPWQRIVPNEHNDWINQRNPAFEGFVALGDKGDKDSATIFETYSRGVATSRDAWAYNVSRTALEANMRRMIDNYNTEVDRYAKACEGAQNKPNVDDVVTNDLTRIKWSSGLKADAERGRKYVFEPQSVVASIYRPFTQEWMYFNRHLNDAVYLMPRFFPTPRHPNLAISVTGIGESKDFSCLVVDCVPNLHLIAGGQCFPLYVYEKAADDRAGSNGLFTERVAAPDGDGYVRREAITDTALANFRRHYGDETISKEDIFYYVYGVLHSAEYRSRYAADLKKMLPRVPYAPDFRGFSRIGRELAYWHLNYETVDPWPVEEDAKPKGDRDDWTYYRVEKMRFASAGGREKDKTTIIYNSRITLRGIPIEAYEYVVNGKSAIEWVMERYAVTVDKDSGIRNDPNAWCREHQNPRYILDLLTRVIRVSMETMTLVRALPSLD